MAEPSGPRAGFGQRAVAAIIDGVLLGVVNVILGAVFNPNFAGVVSTALGLAYYGYFEGGDTGQTIGKRAMSIRVVKTDGEALGTGVALVRYVARIISAIPCGLGYWWALWDPEKQTWHDKIAGTYVVPASSI